MSARDTLKSRVLRSLIPERIPWFAAALYNKMAVRAIDSYYRKVAKEIVAETTQGKILDIGTGPGYLPIEIAKMAPDVDIVGIDLSRRLVAIARKNARDAGVSDRVHFRRGDGNRLEFEDETFDMVISTGSLHAWKDPVRVLDECYRVLKPGGKALIYDPARLISEEMEKLFEQGLTTMEKLAHRWGSFTSKATIPLTAEEFQEVVAKTRFKRGRVEQTRWLTIRLQKEPEQQRSSPGLSE